MSYVLWDYVNEQGKNEFKTWTEGLQKPLRAKLNARLDQLALHGDGLFPEMLAGTNTAGILKLKIKGRVMLRPMLCKGPIDVAHEYTLLLGATERDSKLDPKDADQKANEYKQKVIASPESRRKPHERSI